MTPPCPPLAAVLDGARTLRRLGHSVPPTGATRARLILQSHGWHVPRGYCLDPDRLAAVTSIALALHG